jgi:hypothetical protein
VRRFETNKDMSEAIAIIRKGFENYFTAFASLTYVEGVCIVSYMLFYTSLSLPYFERLSR